MARKEVAASTIPRHLFCLRAAMVASADEEESLLVLA
jgi:hypothetical protein